MQITFRDFPSSEAVDARVREEVARLERLHDRITACRVVLESPHRQHQKGNLFHCSIYLTVPGGDIEITREPPANHAHEDIYVSIRDAFREAARQLDELVDKRQHKVKRPKP